MSEPIKRTGRNRAIAARIPGQYNTGRAIQAHQQFSIDTAREYGEMTAKKINNEADLVKHLRRVDGVGKIEKKPPIRTQGGYIDSLHVKQSRGGVMRNALHIALAGLQKIHPDAHFQISTRTYIPGMGEVWNSSVFSRHDGKIDWHAPMYEVDNPDDLIIMEEYYVPNEFIIHIRKNVEPSGSDDVDHDCVFRALGFHSRSAELRRAVGIEPDTPVHVNTIDDLEPILQKRINVIIGPQCIDDACDTYLGSTANPEWPETTLRLATNHWQETDGFTQVNAKPKAEFFAEKLQKYPQKRQLLVYTHIGDTVMYVSDCDQNECGYMMPREPLCKDDFNKNYRVLRCMLGKSVTKAFKGKNEWTDGPHIMHHMKTGNSLPLREVKKLLGQRWTELTQLGRVVDYPLCHGRSLNIPDVATSIWYGSLHGRGDIYMQSDAVLAAVSCATASAYMFCRGPGTYNAISLDITSMYPYVMKNNKYPVGIARKLTRSDAQSVIDRRDTNVLGICSAVITEPPQPPRAMPLYRPSKMAWYTTVELVHIAASGCIVEVCEDGFQWDSASDLFTEFVDKCFALKLQNAGGSMGKFLLNCLWGRLQKKKKNHQFVKEGGETNLFPTNIQPCEGGYSVTGRDTTNSIYQCSRHAHLGLFVISYGRIFMQSVVNALGRESIIHCHTDGVLVDPTMVNPTTMAAIRGCQNVAKQSLGYIKIESEGQYRVRNVHDVVHIGQMEFAREYRAAQKYRDYSVHHPRIAAAWEEKHGSKWGIKKTTLRRLYDEFEKQ